MKKISDFYNSPYFENLVETKPFLDYLAKEEQELRNCIKGGKVLDVGCGNGRSTLILSDVSDEVVGVDFSERLLEKAKSNLKDKTNVNLYLEDATSTHFSDNYFDNIVMAWNTFGNLYSSRDKVLKEAKRVLKQEGSIFMSIFSENVLSAYFDMLKQNNLVAENYDQNYVFLKEGLVSERFSKDTLKLIFKKYELVPNIKPLTDIAYWCEAKKSPKLS